MKLCVNAKPTPGFDFKVCLVVIYCYILLYLKDALDIYLLEDALLLAVFSAEFILFKTNKQKNCC